MSPKVAAGASKNSNARRIFTTADSILSYDNSSLLRRSMVRQTLLRSPRTTTRLPFNLVKMTLSSCARSAAQLFLSGVESADPDHVETIPRKC